MTFIEWVVIAAILGILAAVIVGIPAQKQARDEFMASCTSAEPAYQCEFKWKQMHPDPVVVYTPLNH